MLKKMCLGLLCASAFFTNATMASSHMLAPHISLEFELVSDKPELFVNPLPFAVRAMCTIQAQDDSDMIHVRGISRVGRVNGRDVNPGEEFDVPVQNGDKLTLGADAAAQVELTNKGQHTVKAVCKTF